jgi:NADH-quinone oxidoreductase subunit M
MPGSANFAGEFLILLGLFNSDLVIAIIAFTGVAMASVYMLRFFIRAMHNRLKAESGSYDIGVRDGLVLVPLVLVILAFAVYPQQALEHSEATVEKVVSAPAADTVAQREVTP